MSSAHPGKDPSVTDDRCSRTASAGAICLGYTIVCLGSCSLGLALFARYYVARAPVLLTLLTGHSLTA